MIDTDNKHFICYDDDMDCPNCGDKPEHHYTHLAEVKDFCPQCDLYFIYNNSSPHTTIEVVTREHYELQERLTVV